PVIYYGDELLMGDNIYLGDRDSVRTPMQWSPDRNGGFSKADFAQLYLPPVMDAVYGSDAVNVEAQCRNPGSFLHWLRGILVQRRAMPVLGVGSMDSIACPNPSVLAYVRSGEVADAPRADPGPWGPTRRAAESFAGGAYGEPPAAATVLPVVEGEDGLINPRTQAVLCVHNLSRFAQPAELSLTRWAGSTPVEVLGRVPFPVIGEEPYTIALGPYGFLWFELTPDQGTP
ncbi:MAG: alpha-glucosidase C-terminal domain-containing protein, partial [Acidimicrobiales bacterium]